MTLTKTERKEYRTVWSLCRDGRCTVVEKYIGCREGVSLMSVCE